MRQLAKATIPFYLLMACLTGCEGGNPPPPTVSSDASLSGLSVSAGSLTPAFQSNTTSYDVVVAAADSSVTVTATTSDASATVTINGSAVASGTASPPVALATGDNTITVLVTAEDGTATRTYTLSVYRLSGDATLSSLTLSQGDLDQIFQSSLMNYTATAGFLQTTVRVTAVANDMNATIMINGTTVASGVESDDISLSEGQNTITVTVTAEDGIATESYIVNFTRQDAASFAQHAYIKASNTDAADNFGCSMALHNNTLAVGACGEASAASGVNGDQADNTAVNSGGVYVFTRDGAGTWTQQAYLKASNSAASDFFGFSVALDGDTLAVGAPEEDSAATGVNGNEADNSATQAGAAYVFTRDVSGTWSQQAYLKASNAAASDRFGGAVALSGDTLAVGAHQEDSSATGINGGQGDSNMTGNSGAVYVFTRDAANAWSQQAYVKASNTGSGDFFGYRSSVALSGDTLAVGAYGEASAATGINGDQTDDSQVNAGAVYVFARDAADTWTQQAYIKASNAGGGDRFGHAVSLSDDTLLVGAPFEASGAIGIDGDQTQNSVGGAGAAYVFTRDAAGVWSQDAYVKASNTGVLDNFGIAVALSGDAVAIFAQNEDGSDVGINGTQTNNSSPSSGAVYVFMRDGSGIWSQQYYVKASNTDAADEFGWSLAISADTLAVGSQLEDSAATGIDGDQTDNTAADAGAVYVFE
jgi:hypothetical protein